MVRRGLGRARLGRSPGYLVAGVDPTRYHFSHLNPLTGVREVTDGSLPRRPRLGRH
jgi:hypothetical protein